MCEPIENTSVRRQEFVGKVNIVLRMLTFLVASARAQSRIGMDLARKL